FCKVGWVRRERILELNHIFLYAAFPKDHANMARKILPYNPKLVPLAKKLRKNSTLSEILLWQRLKRGQLLGYDFHRQKPIGNYIVDFYCPDILLAIEIDGNSHRFKGREDL